MPDKELTKEERRKLKKEEKLAQKQAEERSGNLKKWISIIVVLAIVGYLGYRFISWLREPVPETITKPMEITEADWVKGDENAEVLVVEYGDFQCPACGAYAPMIRQLLEEVEGVKVVYRHLPLVSIHRNAIPAAKAAEAAGKQGKFWEMHDLLFTNQSEWSNERDPYSMFESYANELEIDMDSFKSDYNSDEVESLVNQDLLSANALNLSSTPSIFINGKLHRLTGQYEDLKQEVEQEKGSSEEEINDTENN